jgi:hypothetical protein
MGLKNRILRRDPETATPIADDATAEHPLPAPVEPAPQGDALTAVFEPVPEQPAAAAPELAQPEHAAQGDQLVPAADEPVQARAEATPLGEPADATPLEPLPARRPGFRERGRLRRRLRFLREARELGFRDLGGLVFDQHRFQRPNGTLVQGKVTAIDAADRELRMIEDVLAARRPYEELFVAGVSACQRCGALHGSDARFCPQCGLAFSGPRPVAGVWTAEGAPPGQSALFDPQAPRTEAPTPPA